MTGLVQEDAENVVSRADIEAHRGVDLDVSRGGRAVGRGEVRLREGRRVAGERVAPEADVSEPGIALRAAQDIEVVGAIADGHEVDVGHRLPGCQRPGDLLLPGPVGTEPGVERRIQVIRAVIPEDSIRRDAVGDVAGIGPALAGEEVVIPRDRGHQVPVFESFASGPGLPAGLYAPTDRKTPHRAGIRNPSSHPASTSSSA